MALVGGRATRSAVAAGFAIAVTAASANAIPAANAMPAAGGGAGLSAPSKRSGGPTGGAPIGGLAPTGKRNRRIPRPPSKHDHGTWLRHVMITEYWPAPESWFRGARVKAPGLPGRHRIDWLYSAMGMSMQGDGIGLDGRLYHINALGRGGWVTAAGTPTSAGDGWSAGAPYWRAGGYWQGPGGVVTFPLSAGGWSAGWGRRYVSLPGVTFASGGPARLHFYRSLAVDPSVIPLGSRVYIPAYRRDGHGGWFLAQDTGGAIVGAHVDVYRSPPSNAGNPGHELTRRRVFVIKPRG
jgi:3D (Asp-Asp-Asp) domain-containing protein